MKTTTLEYIIPKLIDTEFHFCKPYLVQIKKKTANIWWYRVDIKAIIANVVHLWKPRMFEVIRV